MKDKSKLAEKIVEVVNSTSNDYDAKELIEKELWDHYSGLPNPDWYNEDNWDATLQDGLEDEEWDEDHALDQVMNGMVDDIEELEVE